MKKLDVNQELCRKVQIMLAGAKSGEVAKLLGISKTTVSRIKMAGFDAEVYKKNTEKRVAEENRSELEKDFRFPMKVEEVVDTGDGILVKARQAEEQVQGQISMDDLQAEEPPKEMSDQVKLMRFQAAQVEKITSKLDKAIDYMAQILRKMDG